MLKGKTAIVTGASRGIGRAIALELASQGANIAAICVGNSASAERAQAYRCDVSSYGEAKEVTAQIRKEFGAVQILVNNAGITRDGLLAMMKEEDFDAVLNTNLKGAFNMIRHCTGLFLRAKEGCIVNITSVVGMMGNAGQCNYAASKAGLIGLTKSVARELAPKGIRCNAIAPGFIATDMTRGQGENPMLAQIPLGRMGAPEEVAQAAAFLAQAA